MVADMSFDTVSNVFDSWEIIRRMPNYEELLGKKLFIRLFQLEPEAKKIFGFSSGDSTNVILDDSLIASRHFALHSKYFIQMIDKALGMLGPDIDLLTDILLDLGKKHINYGVRPEYFPSMGFALIQCIQEALGDAFTDEVKYSWVEVYGALSYDMIRGQKI